MPHQGGHPALKQPEGRQRSEGAGCLALLPAPIFKKSIRIATSLPSYHLFDLDIGHDLPAVLARAVALRSVVVVSAVVDGCSPFESNCFQGTKPFLIT